MSNTQAPLSWRRALVAYLLVASYISDRISGMQFLVDTVPT